MKDITEEDAISVAKLFHQEYEWRIVENSEMLTIVECYDYRIFIYKSETDFIDFEELYHDEENIEAHGGESEACSPYRSIIDIIDFLRFKGYTLPNKFSQTNNDQ